ncbi:NADP-dependent oxidoreductase domain-containing protein [Diplogelasinospora grovesii]|uniref:NADP-dependent oxidoreductase domain-containing protein n=1 Tax=Diplogelasinospora grovesii TaxID=303347 RepID=A0AAN6NE41_9PEZI|nr:NADP-dependent oxidoreductase domain-containing protein [Diplogelasinospora grovesii]
MSSRSPLRQLGKNGPMVAAVGFGLMELGGNVYGSTPGDEERFAILDQACGLGARFWDLSDLYGDSEELVGRWFKRTGKRADIFLATKFGFVKGSKTYEIDSSGEYCKKACAESLRLLDINCIDLYYMHHANPDTPIEETMRALVDLKAEGKIRYIGLSGISSATLRRACKIGPVAAVQIEYSAFVLDIEGPKGTDLLATCRELGVAIVAYSPLGRGLLTNTFAQGAPVGDDKDRRSLMMPRFQEANRDKNVEVVRQFKTLADKKGCSTTQLALAWLMKQGDDIIPIPGTKRLKYLDENWASLILRLSDEEEAEIRRFVENVDMAGGNLPKMWEHMAFTNTKEEV